MTQFVETAELQEVRSTESKPSQSKKSSKKASEMIIRNESINIQPSVMPDDLKEIKRANSPELNSLLTETLEHKGEADSVQIQQNELGQLIVEGVSQSALHSFLLKAEEIGKKITYKRVLEVKITD